MPLPGTRLVLVRDLLYRSGLMDREGLYNEGFEALSPGQQNWVGRYNGKCTTTRVLNQLLAGLL